jgi:DNA-binding transcriptional LysR family regulator
VPRLAATGYPVAVPLADEGASRELAVIWREGGQLSPAAQVFLELLVAAAET